MVLPAIFTMFSFTVTLIGSLAGVFFALAAMNYLWKKQLLYQEALVVKASSLGSVYSGVIMAASMTELLRESSPESVLSGYIAHLALMVAGGLMLIAHIHTLDPPQGNTAESRQHQQTVLQPWSFLTTSQCEQEATWQTFKVKSITIPNEKVWLSVLCMAVWTWAAILHSKGRAFAVSFTMAAATSGVIGLSLSGQSGGGLMGVISGGSTAFVSYIGAYICYIITATIAFLLQPLVLFMICVGVVVSCCALGQQADGSDMAEI